MVKQGDMKKPPDDKFIPTELGSAVFASVDGRPTDEEYLILNKNSKDDVKDGAGHNKENS